MNARRATKTYALWAAAVILTPLLVLLGAPPASAAPQVTITPIATGLPSPVGLTYYVPTGQLLSSVNFPTGTTTTNPAIPGNFALVTPTTGAATAFSTESGFKEELKLASVLEPSGGFTVGDVFFSEAPTAQIFRFPAGSTTPVLFASLPAAENNLEIYLYKDTTGAFGGNLLAASASGNVYEITSTGTVTLLASAAAILASLPPGTQPSPDQARVILEGMTTVPNLPQYGPWAGTAVIASEIYKGFFSVSPTGTVKFWNLNIPYPEDLRVLGYAQQLYIAGFAKGIIWSVSSSSLAPFTGDIIVGEEFPANLWDTKYNSTTHQFVATQIGGVPSGQFEQMTLAPSGNLMVDCSVGVTMLWPPNHDLRNVGLSVQICSGFPVTGTSVTVYSNEPDLPRGNATGDDHFSPDAKYDPTSGVLRLRSERLGNGPGRVYLIVVQATNTVGQTGFCVSTVVVPHSQSPSSIAFVKQLAATAVADALTHNGAPPVGYVQVGTGPTVGPKQ